MSLTWFRQLLLKLENSLRGEDLIACLLTGIEELLNNDGLVGVGILLRGEQAYCQTCPDENRCQLNHHCSFWKFSSPYCSKENYEQQRWEEQHLGEEQRLAVNWERLQDRRTGILQRFSPGDLIQGGELADQVRYCYAGKIHVETEEIALLFIATKQKVEADKLEYLAMLCEHVGRILRNISIHLDTERSKEKLKRENELLRHEVFDEFAQAGRIIGASQALRKVMQQVELVAPTDATVLIHGESGTGKELLAFAIHQGSQRRDQPFVKVNCGAIPRELFESEFFGHVKGAFTGAVNNRQGRFQLAHRGTLFLDEVGEIPLDLQSKLLRVLQEGQFEAVGDEKTQQVDVRIISATNRVLENSPDFRQDLYYRLCVFPVYLPPLRERKEDIPLLARYFWTRACQKFHLDLPPLTDRDLRCLFDYDWPGNVRELRNVIERAVILARKHHTPDLPRLIPADSHEPPRPRQALPESPSETAGSSDLIWGAKGYLTAEEFRQLERENLIRVLRLSHGKVSGKEGAAAKLGIPPSTLFSRLKTLNIDYRRFETLETQLNLSDPDCRSK
ncbi:MAG: AAA family ATPase [Lentisphaerae bacterium]|nr:MAG: AAA family ATPase [Lentisphaerota bacterium]